MNARTHIFSIKNVFSQVLPSLSHVIQTGTFLTSGESNSSLKSLSGVGTSGNFNVTTLEGQPVILTEGSFIAPGGIQQQQQSDAELSDGNSKIVEYSSNTETNLEFLNTTTGTVEFTTQDIVTQQSQPTTGDGEVLLNSIVEPQEPQPIKAEGSTDIQQTTTKTLKVSTDVLVFIFGRSQVKISAWRPGGNLTLVFHVFLSTSRQMS